MTLKTGLSIFALTSLLAVGGWYWQTQQQSTLAPETSFTTIAGQTLTLQGLKGKPLLINFWATDCPSCIEEIPNLINLHRQYNQLGLTIIAIAMYYDPPNHVLTLATENQIPYAIALDPEQTLAKAFDNVQLTPTTFLVNSKGKIVWKQLGSIDLEAVQQQLDALLHTD
jgi:thiol-disulfide isomerase/thioredoxin